MNKGFLRSILCYIIGIALAGISYVAVGHGYIHAPGLHHIIILVIFVGGFLWLVGATIRYFSGLRTEILKGIIFANLFMSVAFTLFMVHAINDDKDKGEFEEDADKLRIEETGDTTTMYHGESIIYVKIKDSVLINFVDSTKINWNEVELKKK